MDGNIGPSRISQDVRKLTGTHFVIPKNNIQWSMPHAKCKHFLRDSNIIIKRVELTIEISIIANHLQ